MANPRLRLRWRLEEVSNEMPYKKDNGDSVPGFHRAELLKHVETRGDDMSR
jgi:hypothetical protein